MQFPDLQAFLAVQATGSVSKAASHLHLTQPAITRRIQSLEANLGVQLFDRVGKTLVLSPAGAVFLQHASKLISSREDARRAMADLGTTVAGPLRLVTSHHIGLHRLAPVLKDFTRAYPEVTLDIHFEDSEAAHDLVRSASRELAVVTLDPRGTMDLAYEPIWSDPLEFVVASDHPWAAVTQVDLAMLASEPAILPDLSTYTGRLVVSLFEQHGQSLRTSMSTNYLETIGMLVAAGLGWSVLPRTMLSPDLTRLSIGVDVPVRMLGAVTNQARTLSNAGLAFLAVLRHHQTLPVRN